MRRIRSSTDKWRCDGHAKKKRKPNQHEADDQVGVAQGLHGMIMKKRGLSAKTGKRYFIAH
jgi:hypothetical protein